MRYLPIAGLLALLLSACTVSFDPPNQQQELPAPTAGTKAEQEEAVKAARGYMAMIDRGDHKALWLNAGPVLRDMSNETAFAMALKLTRKTMALLPGRKIEGLGFNTQADPGGPIGEYAVVIVVGRSGNLTATEKIVMQKEEGRWKLIGYFIKKERKAGAQSS